MTGQVYSGLANLARVRARLPQLHASVSSQVLTVDDWGVLATLRRHPVGQMVGLYNVTDGQRPWSAEGLVDPGLDRPFDAISSRFVEPDVDGNFWLPPYTAWWLVDRH